MPENPAEILETFEARWKNLTIANDFVFCKAMLDPDLCRDVIEAILGIPIDHVEYVGRQEAIDSLPPNKGIRLDVYVRDESGTVFDVEMQSIDTRELPKRSRYYQSLLTVDQLRRGESYKTLKDSFVIFICCFDLFELDRRVYWFENTCRDVAGLTLGDGAKTIFLAATAPRTGDGSNPMDELLDYVASGEVTGELSARLASAVADVLDDKRWRLEYMMLEVRDQLNFDRGVLEGRAEGIKKGHELGLAEGFEVGIEQGREQGLADGIEQGREQGLADGIAQGREQGLADGIAQGREQGLADGIAQGREQGLADGIAQGREQGLADGIAQGREEGLADGINRGMTEGIAQGEDRLARLIAAIVQDGQTDLIERVVQDNEFRADLYRRYGIV